MKISPVAQGSGTPGQSLTSAEVGRTADPVKMDRARAIARGEKVEQAAPSEQSQRSEQNVRKIKMNTQRSVYREEQDAAPQQEDTSTIPESSEPAAVEATQPLSPQFAALAKQKRALQVKEKELETREKALTEGSPKIGDSDLIAKLKSRPLDVLKEHGVTYDQLTEAILSEDSINPEIQALREELKAVKEDVNKTLSTKEEQAEEAALTEMLYEAESLAKDGDAFEMIRERNAYDRVLRLIHDTYKKTGRVLDVSEAMGKIEDTLLIEAEKYARIGKVQKRISPPPQPLQPQQKSNQMRTLTARDSASGVMSAKARAIAAFNGTLKR